MVKTVNQLLCGVHIAVVAEAFSLAGKVGVDLDVMLEILQRVIRVELDAEGSRARGCCRTTPPVTSAVDIFVKDLGIVLEAGRDARPPCRSPRWHIRCSSPCPDRASASADDSQVIRAYRTLNEAASVAVPASLAARIWRIPSLDRAGR